MQSSSCLSLPADVAAADARMPYFCLVVDENSGEFEEVAEKAGVDQIMVRPIFKEQMHQTLIKCNI